MDKKYFVHQQKYFCYYHIRPEAGQIRIKI